MRFREEDGGLESKLGQKEEFGIEVYTSLDDFNLEKEEAVKCLNNK